MKKFSLILGAAKATKIETLNMAQLDSQFSDVNGQLECTTVATDLCTFAQYFGIDMRTTWLEGSDDNKKTLWSFLNLIDSEILNVHDAIGVKGPEQVSISAQMDELAEEMLQSISDSKVAIQGTRGYNLEHIVYYTKQAELNQTDILREIVDRLRFITQRMAIVE